MPVEVERKFVCDSNIQQKLKDLGAQCLGQYEFTDQYFDSPDFTLTLRDFWLRKRDGAWELKRPGSLEETKEERLEKLCTNYKEITDLQQIKEELRNIVKSQTEETSDFAQTERQRFNAWLRDLNLECFAEFTTVRCSYTLGGDQDGARVRVDLDQADFGFCVGEIEILVSDSDDMTAAMHRIDETAQSLGLDGERKAQGKMEAYLQRFQPLHYSELLKAHIL